MQMVSIASCGPTTCSVARRSSMANWPWVTMTRPIKSTHLNLLNRSCTLIKISRLC